jgi:hypothetical protein
MVDMVQVEAVAHADVVGIWSAAATTVATVLALVFGVYAEVRLRRDRREQDQREARAQAARVSGWVVERSWQSTSGGAQPAAAVLQNAGESAVFDVHACLTRENCVTVPIIPPGATVRADLPRPLHEFREALNIRFRDGAGLRWLREQGGALHVVEPPG